MAVYYKFKSAKFHDEIKLDWLFISVLNLKERIFESKRMEKGSDFDLIITNAQTNEEYVDESVLIPRNTSVMVRRVAGPPRMPIVCRPKPKVENEKEEDDDDQLILTSRKSLPVVDDLSEFDDFGDDIYKPAPEFLPKPIIIPLPALPVLNSDSPVVKAVTESSSGLGWNILQLKTPPQGYICHRCNVSGHYIQHCPTNGDRNFDIRKVQLPPVAAATSIVPKLVERGHSSTQSSSVNIPPELYCPICKDVMKDAVFTSKCCYSSFCDRCIRDCISSKSMCYCKATNVLADNLLPNPTVRETIKRILVSGSKTDSSRSTITDDVAESAPTDQRKRSRDQCSMERDSDSDSKRLRSEKNYAAGANRYQCPSNTMKDMTRQLQMRTIMC